MVTLPAIDFVTLFTGTSTPTFNGKYSPVVAATGVGGTARPSAVLGKKVALCWSTWVGPAMADR